MTMSSVWSRFSLPSCIQTEKTSHRPPFVTNQPSQAMSRTFFVPETVRKKYPRLSVALAIVSILIVTVCCANCPYARSHN